ncbi:hypothetical protein KAR91_44655, partial [Candidatus Pacearchaeota archaeon]|nr:hypothetical protein [Candidatus Pacearchaeota archaeon]
MTQDLPNTQIIEFCKDARSKARSYLEKLYQFHECDISDEDVSHVSKLNKNADIWRVTAQSTVRPYTFIIAVPDIFPDKLPKFYLPKKDYSAFGILPHVSRKRLICTRDPAVVVINDSKPGEAIEDLLKIAISILEKGLRKELISDFKEEFLAYWDDGRTFSSILVCPPPID